MDGFGNDFLGPLLGRQVETRGGAEFHPTNSDGFLWPHRQGGRRDVRGWEWGNGPALARSGWGLSISCGSRTLGGVGNDFLGPLLGKQVQAFIVTLDELL